MRTSGGGTGNQVDVVSTDAGAIEAGPLINLVARLRSIDSSHVDTVIELLTGVLGSEKDRKVLNLVRQSLNSSAAPDTAGRDEILASLVQQMTEIKASMNDELTVLKQNDHALSEQIDSLRRAVSAEEENAILDHMQENTKLLKKILEKL